MTVADTAAAPQMTTQHDPSGALAHWLAAMARSGNTGAICDLQRPHQPSEALALAGRFATDEKDRPAFEFTATLFAQYHAALPWRDSIRHYGSGDMGAALRRVGSGALRGPSDPGCDRLFKQLVGPGALPWRHLQHAIARLRSADRFPPSWSQLARDLSTWSSPDREVQHRWARSFWAPRRSR
ncbi:type I-E CRISPR-associated protein Cse2/CasB [Streptomyces lydicus]|uniref:type I-E CRISPR-associated protein Cse2/CasB n=1 Tax=Streptomyces lydicus TaxID=47763 RepID=UPI0036ECBCD6